MYTKGALWVWVGIIALIVSTSAASRADAMASATSDVSDSRDASDAVSRCMQYLDPPATQPAADECLACLAAICAATRANTVDDTTGDATDDDADDDADTGDVTQRTEADDRCARAQAQAELVRRARRHLPRARSVHALEGREGSPGDAERPWEAAVWGGLLGVTGGFVATSAVVAAARTPTTEASVWLLATPVTMGGVLAGGAGWLVSRGDVAGTMVQAIASGAVVGGMATSWGQLALHDVVGGSSAALGFSAMLAGGVVGLGAGALAQQRLQLDPAVWSTGLSGAWSLGLIGAGAGALVDVAVSFNGRGGLALGGALGASAGMALGMATASRLSLRRSASWVFDAAAGSGALVGAGIGAVSALVGPARLEHGVVVGAGLGVCAGGALWAVAVLAAPALRRPPVVSSTLAVETIRTHYLPTVLVDRAGDVAPGVAAVWTW